MDLFKHPSVSKTDNNSLLINKGDHVIELKEHDSACPPGTVGGLRVNSFSAWARIDNNPWFRVHHLNLAKVLKIAVESETIAEFEDSTQRF